MAWYDTVIGNWTPEDIAEYELAHPPKDEL